MSRYNPYKNAPPVHAAAERWRDRCLLQDHSIFGEETDLWNLEVFDELDLRFSQNLDAGEGDFYQKLKAQLSSGSNKCKRLMAEVMWVVLLFSENTSAPKKREIVELIWSWSGADFPVDHPMLADEVLPGLASTGTAYNTHRWRELVYLIAAMRDFKARDAAGRAHLLSEPGDFAEWLHGIPDEGNRQLRHIMTHLIFPDTFERISSERDKLAVISAFSGMPEKELMKLPLIERDRKLLEIREKLESERGEPIDFYLPEIEDFWRDNWRTSEGNAVGVDWSAFDRQVAWNEAEKGISQDRRDVMKIVRSSQLHPHPEYAAATKMGAVLAPDGEVIVVEYSRVRPNLWFGQKHAEILMTAGLQLEESAAWDQELNREGRHSGLKSQGFRDNTAWKLGELGSDEVKNALEIVGIGQVLVLDPRAIDRWVSVLRSKFSGFAHFAPPNEAFDKTETDYKLRRTERLKEALTKCVDPADYAQAIRVAFGGYNLLNQFLMMNFGEDWPKDGIGQVVTGYLERDGEVPENFVAEFTEAWMRDCPNPQRDHARQVASLVAMHLYPEKAIYFRRTVLDKFYQEATGQAFPRSDNPADEYSEELRFGRAIEQAFANRVLAPRNLMDVQSALWVVHNHTGETAVTEEATTRVTEDKTMPETLNTILYGPPGTGKTYATAEEAVRICDGAVPEHSDSKERRKLIMGRYHELSAEKRIEFVTFHQSYGYEEFVEGLRPETGDENEGEGQGAGFRLVPVDGVVKRIADRARHRSAVKGEGFDPNGRQVFKMSLGMVSRTEHDYIRQECFENGYVLSSFGGEVDWSSPKFNSWNTVFEHWKSMPGNEDATGNNQHVVQAWQLRVRMKPGDVIIVPLGLRKAGAIGIVTGNYEYVHRDFDDYHHRRSIDWVWIDETSDGIEVSDFYDSDFSRHMLNGLVSKKLRWGGLLPFLQEQDETAPKPPHVLIIDEINRANISKVMGELITLLEEDKREGETNALSVVLPHSMKAFMLPANLHILGTMNTADRSIALLDTALRRRFKFKSVDPDPSLLKWVEGINLQAVLTVINARLEYLIGPDHLIGHAWLMEAKDVATLDHKMATMVIPLMREYFHEDLGRVRAILGGGDAFLRRVALTPPPGLDDGYGETRYRYIDVYKIEGGYGASAYNELLKGVAEGGEAE